MAIEINTGFQLGSKEPIDNRYIKETTTERNQLVTDGLVYEGLKVYCKDTKKEYRWTGAVWKIVEGGSGGDLTDLTTHTDNTDIHVTTTDKEILQDVNAKKHEHSNKIQLDKISENDDGELMYNGKVINSMYISEETNRYNNNSGANVTLYFTILGNKMTIFLIQRASNDGNTIHIKYPIPFKTLPTITRTFGSPYGIEKTNINTLTAWAYDQNYGGQKQNELHFMIQGTI